MKLPDRFQMRLNTYPGHTHTVKRNPHGDYEVTWARGFPSLINSLPSVVWNEQTVLDLVQDCRWIIVDEQPKAAVKQALPDVFYFQNMIGYAKERFVMIREGNEYSWRCWKEGRIGEAGAGGRYSEREIKYRVQDGWWKIIDKKPITAEQKRANKDYQDQIAALESSIKIAQQAEEHQKRMQANYLERIETLKAKLVEGV